MRSKYSKETRAEVEAIKNVKRKRGRPKLTPKQRLFARKYVELGSKTEAYAQAYDAENMQRKTITRSAIETAALPHVNAEIERLFAANGMDLTTVLSIHARNMTQEEHLPTSQRAVGEFYELVGLKKVASTPTVNVAFMINRAQSEQGVEVARIDSPVVDSGQAADTHEDE